MRGELLNVWEDTYREIWTPLLEEEGVPIALFSQLYYELSLALKEPLGEDAQVIPLSDAIQFREAFDQALSMSGAEITLTAAEVAFGASGATNYDDLQQRRSASEECLAGLIDDAASAKRLLAQALSDLADNPERRAEATARARDAIVNNAYKSKQTFEHIRSSEIVGEVALVRFLESAFEILEDVGGDPLSNRYFNLLSAFIDKFSLRYDLRCPCTLCPTLPGMFTALLRELDTLSTTDQNIDRRLRDFKESIQDLRMGPTEGRISNCVIKQVMFLEAVAAASGDAAGGDLAALCRTLEHWPHPAVRTSLLNLYGFASDFPGVRHGTPSTGMERDIGMRDMVAVSILLAGFTPYLTHGLNPDVVYRGT